MSANASLERVKALFHFPEAEVYSLCPRKLANFSFPDLVHLVYRWKAVNQDNYHLEILSSHLDSRHPPHTHHGIFRLIEYTS